MDEPIQLELFPKPRGFQYRTDDPTIKKFWEFLERTAREVENEKPSWLKPKASQPS
jgi:hypothetical protein